MERYNGRVTVEEMLDSIFNRTPASATLAHDSSSTPYEYEQEGEGIRPGIYSKNYMLMEQAIKHPSKAESLLKAYVTHGWKSLSSIPQNQLLHYCTIAALLQECKEPSLIALCRRYDPREKFILSVSIIADIEYCPETPPPEISEMDHTQQNEITAIALTTVIAFH
ncbi:hypothetical protein TELCIR_09409 [Teladorsagia circumcincta]|uniref:Apical junction molecule ajm1 alpha/beta domain-containing protein n=1 Tax=Teladorsagia circumcincta TaxID=45464 RepID=A0A2G9UEX6_TELCI|nr:hypothetical protein TELCIR_09409 [Teladorsagia circumcincta]